MTIRFFSDGKIQTVPYNIALDLIAQGLAEEA